jgi:hypothetical protein
MKILTYAVMCLVALALATACALWGGFAAATLWGWFVVPLGVPEVSVLHAMGLTLAMRALAGFSGKPQPAKHEDKMVALRAPGRRAGRGDGVRLARRWRSAGWCGGRCDEGTAMKPANNTAAMWRLSMRRHAPRRARARWWLKNNRNRRNPMWDMRRPMKTDRRPIRSDALFRYLHRLNPRPYERVWP